MWQAVHCPLVLGPQESSTACQRETPTDGAGTAVPEGRVSIGAGGAGKCTDGWALLLNTWSWGLHPFRLLRMCAHSSRWSGQVGGVESEHVCFCLHPASSPPPHS